jgi:glycosyltransferase involved in cell wall biosynthesis
MRLGKSAEPLRARGAQRRASTDEAAATSRSALGRALDYVDAALAIPDHESAWLLPAIARGLAECVSSPPDVLYSSAPPWTVQLVAAALAGAVRCPWVADFRDPWGRAPWREDRKPFTMRAARGLERFVVNRADRVVFVSRANRDEFAAHYGAAVASKFRVVPNGCDVSDFANVDHAPSRSDTFVLLHAGSLYAGRTPAPLLKAVAAAIDRGTIDPERFRLRFLGPVVLAGSPVANAVEELGLSRVVEFLPRVPRAESIRAMTESSGLLLLQPGHGVAVPAKVYEYMAAGRPILAIAEGETADIVRASGAGIAVDSTDHDGIVAALTTFMEMARAPFHRPQPEAYDGAKRAAEIAAFLSESAGGMAPIGKPDREGMVA